jgi:predicted PolB exonuclease-like 3'-5' exonuclease
VTPILAFDIETVPDCAGIRRLYGLADALPDSEVAEVAFQKRRAQSGSDFLPPHLQKVVVISCVLRDSEGLKVFSIGEPERDERTSIQKFYDGVEKYVPQLVSWNGGGFDLPVLNYRALANGVSAPKFWDQGEDDRDFKWNSYLGRYHSRHLDLMDVLAMYQPRNNAPLDAVARIAGFPGKIGGDPRLLRGRLREHLPAVPALPAVARRVHQGAVRQGVRAAAHLDRIAEGAPLGGIPFALARSPL